MLSGKDDFRIGFAIPAALNAKLSDAKVEFGTNGLSSQAAGYGTQIFCVESLVNRWIVVDTRNLINFRFVLH